MLTDWAHWYKLTIDSSKIDSTLSNFPVQIVLSSGTGLNNFDATHIFTHLGDEYKRLVVTDSSDNILPTEIECWDSINEKACLWSRIPTISSGTDTTLYLYYDMNKPNQDIMDAGIMNDTFTGTDGSSVDSTKWSVAGSVDIYNNRIRLQVSSSPTYSVSATINHVAGDFDVMADWYLITFPSTDNCRTTLEMRSLSTSWLYRMERIYTAATGHHYRWEQRNAAGSFSSGGAAVTTDTSGRFRFTRVGTTITAYHWSGGIWNSFKQWTGSDAVADNVIFSIFASVANLTPTVHVQWDDFTINSGTVVGLTGSTASPAGRRVWSGAAFTNVWHMAEVPPALIKDSTFANNSGSPEGSMTTADSVFGKVGRAIDFDGTDDCIDTSTALSIGPNCSFSWTGRTASLSGQRQIMSGVSASHRFAIDATKVHYGFGSSYPATYFIIDHGVDPTTDTHHYAFTLSSDAKTFYLYVDGQYVGSNYNSSGGATISVYNIGGKDFVTTWLYYLGTLDEIRFHTSTWSSAIIKADYYSQWNQLMSFEDPPEYYYYGTVTELSSPVSRTVRLYNRASGELIDSDISVSGTGYYYLTTTISGEHYVVALDDDTGETYNALINDKLLPRGTV